MMEDGDGDDHDPTIIAQHLRSAGRFLAYLTERKQEHLDPEYAAGLSETATLMREVADDIDNEDFRGRRLAERSMYKRASAILDRCEREIVRAECVIEHGTEPFATAKCPDWGQKLAIPKTAPVECTICHYQPTRTEVFSQ